jgi:Methyltransferase domain
MIYASGRLGVTSRSQGRWIRYGKRGASYSGDPTGFEDFMGLRTVARQVKEHSRESYRRWMLRRDLAVLNRVLHSGRAPPVRLLSQLVRNWGNESWSADTALLESIIEWFPRTTGLTVECGSGLSTLLLASLATTHDRQVWSLEQDTSWAEKVKDALSPQMRTHVEVLVAPICQYPDFDWYCADAVSSLSAIEFIVCDGPPGSTRGGRYGLAPILKARIVPGCILVLDDSHRPEERSIIEKWRHEIGAVVVDERGTHSVLRLGHTYELNRGRIASNEAI